MANQPAVPKWRFNLRAVLIIIAWFSVILAFVGPLVRMEIVPVKMWFTLALFFVGSLVGTFFGICLEVSERNRWIFTSIFTMFFGIAALNILYIREAGVSATSLFPVFLWSMAFSFLPAIATASLVELLRMMLSRFAGPSDQK